MTQTFPNQSKLSSRTLLICGLLSLGLHAGLLAGFNMIQRSEPLRETVPLVNVTLVPTEIPTEPTTSRETPDPVPPPMRTTPRSTQAQAIASPSSPAVTQPRPIMATSELKISPVVPTTPPPTLPIKKRMLQDTQATDALFAQQITKLVKRSTTANLPSLPESNVPHRPITNFPMRRSLSPTVTAINTTPAAYKKTHKRRLLTAQAPTTMGTGIAKIGVRHSVQPVYPRVAKEEGWEGVVLLKVLVQTNGVPGKITVRKSSGHSILDWAAIEAMRQWRFAPAMDGNFPVEKYLQVPLKFGLHR